MVSLMVPLAIPTAMVPRNTMIMGAGNRIDETLAPSMKSMVNMAPKASNRPMIVAGSN